MGPVRPLLHALAALLLLDAAPPDRYFIDASHYFPNPGAEAQSRATVVAEATAFIASPTPATVEALYRPVAEDRRAAHSPARGEVVGERAVLRPAVIPKRDRTGLPAPTHLKVRLRHVFEEQS